MNKSITIICTTVAAIAVVGILLFPRQPAPTIVPEYIGASDAALVMRGKTVYDQNCASCHGAELEGQPNWRERLPNGRLPAPPHDASGHTWHHPDSVLIAIIRDGLVPGTTAPEGYESDMPAYGGTLKDRDIVAVLAYIKSNWPAEALEAQRGITLQN